MNELRDRAGADQPPRRNDGPDRNELLDMLHELGLGGDFSLERLLDRVVEREPAR